MSLKVKATQQELAAVNKQFHCKLAQDLNELYALLQQYHIDYKECILFNIFPDGGRSYCGNIIIPDGRVMGFDLDPDNPEYNEWKDETKIWYQEYRYYKSRKPWLKIVVAYEMFYTMH